MPASASEANGAPAEPRYVALIGDIQGSREAEDRAALQERFDEAVEAVNGRYNTETEPQLRTLVSPLTVTAGDEFQALFSGPHPEEATLAILAMSDEMAPSMLRFGLGYGTLETPPNTDQAIGMDGPCLRNARDGLDQAKDEGGWIRARGFPTPPDLEVGRMMDTVGVLREGWTDRQAEFARSLRRYEFQKAVAEEHDVSESTVSESLSAAGYHEIDRSVTTFGALLKSAVLAQPSEEASR